MNIYLIFTLIIAMIIIVYLICALWRVKTQLVIIKDALEDIKNGNLNRRVLARENDMTREICYDINEIATNNQVRFIQQKQSEQAYKRLMTSLSHDVKTPLASLIGYLEAVESKIVVGEEKDEYIKVAFDKSKHLKYFVENLFDWVKLNSGEQAFRFEVLDLNELSRNIIADWIPILEKNNFEYEFDIPTTECLIRVDVNAYTRILNNLLQNIIVHSEGNCIKLCIFENKYQVKITIYDNGKGISSENLSHIFERLYKCDKSRSSKGSGLGLSIVKELISVHHGDITTDSTLGLGTTFTILFPKVL